MVRPDIEIIKGYIEDHLFEIKEKDALIRSHVLEHVYQPVEFITQISNHMSIDTDMFISFPNMEGLIESGGMNSLNFEHTYLLDPNQAETIFMSAGFEVLDMKKYLTHSYFYHLKKRSNMCNKLMEFNNIGSQSIKFLRMIELFVKFVGQANKLIDAHSGPIYLFGAHVFSQSLIFLGLKTDKIVGILDNDTEKQNKRLYGTPFQVSNLSVISELDNVMVVLNASHYQSEVRNQLISINRNIKIVENS